MKKKLKDYTTEIEANKTIIEVQDILAKSGAKGIALEYDDSGNIESLFFRMVIQGGQEIAFKLPAKPQAVYDVLYKGMVGERNPNFKNARWQKSLNIAWRIMKEWLEIQFTLIKLNQVEAIEIFLPYMVTGQNRTLYSDMKENQFQLSSGQ